MGLNDNYSDYGSGSSSSSWMSQQDIRWPPYTAKQTEGQTTHKSYSYSDLVMRRCTLEDVMREFQMNGSDSPYNPEEDRLWRKQTTRHDLPLGGLGPGSAYVRQKSWPAPERSPAPALPRPETLDFATSTPINHEAPVFVPSTPVFNPTTPAFDPTTPAFAPPTPVFDPSTLGLGPSPPAPAPSTPAFVPSPSAFAPSVAAPAATECLTSEQFRVLSSLPSSVLHSLIKQLNIEKRNKNFQECRFCKNNGERESYYRSHALKDGAGRVACPVLRAFTCARCGARGDRAHTIKYCPLSTNEERIKSSAMMRSVRMASGRRRGAGEAAPAHAHAHEYVVCGARTPSVVRDNSALASYSYNNWHDAPLDPLWAALEQKLML